MVNSLSFRLLRSLGFALSVLVLCLSLLLNLTWPVLAAEGPEDISLAAPSPVETISTGNGHTCVLKPDGSVDCQGWNQYGQANDPPGIFTQISAGGYHNCGLRSDGTLYCWGGNDAGQSSPPTGTFTQVSAGYAFSCAIRTDGTLTCWGYNGSGATIAPVGIFSQVSAGYEHACGVRSDGATACWGRNYDGESTPWGGLYAQVSAGRNFSCGLRSDGNLICWGNNTYGQLNAPTGVFTQVSAGGYHACARRYDGTLTCWGWNGYGQTNPPPWPFTQVSASDYAHTCGLLENGSMLCWGYSIYGQTEPISGSFGLRRVSSGPDHTCVLKENGTLACFGSNADGRASPPAGYFTQVLAGAGHSCGLSSSGMAACWGLNSYGQASPPTVPFIGLTAGIFHSCGLRSNGSVACWGDNTWNALNLPFGFYRQVGAAGYRTCAVSSSGLLVCTPGNAPPSGSFTQVSGGQDHFCAIRSDGTLACWGSNSYGQSEWPSGGYTQVSAGYFHNCAIKSDGTLACWGRNDAGQAAAPAGTFAQVSAGAEHTCAVRPDGTLTCWGGNTAGQAPRLALTPGSLPGGPVGSAYSQNLSASGGTAPYTFALVSGNLPPGLSLSASGQISGTPTSGGSYTFTVQVTDSWSVIPLSAQQSYTLSFNTPPVLGEIPTLSGPEGEAIQFTASASDLDGHALTYLILDPPAGAEIDTSTGSFTWTPGEAAGPGDYTFELRVTDSGQPSLYDQQTVSVHVDEVNAAPVLNEIGDRSVDEEESLSFTISATDPDLPANNLTLSASGLPAGASFDPASGQFAWTPGEAQGQDVYSITFTVTDSGSPAYSDSETIQVTVNEVNLAPSAAADAYTATAGTQLSVSAAQGLLANDSDPDSASLTASLVTGPAHGTLDLRADGSFDYTPQPGFGGSDSFSYRVFDGVGYSPTVTVSIFVNTVPVVDLGDNLTIDEGTLANFTALITDSFGFPAQWSVAWAFGDGASLTGGTAVSHLFEDNGLFNVAAAVTDPYGVTGSGSLQVTVDNVAPKIQPVDSQQTRVGQACQLSMSFTDPGVRDTHRVEILWEEGVKETINLDAHVLSFSSQHVYTRFGTFEVPVSVTDPDGGADTYTVKVTVQPYRVLLPVLRR